MEHSGLSCGRAQRLPGASASLRANAGSLGCRQAEPSAAPGLEPPQGILGQRRAQEVVAWRTPLAGTQWAPAHHPRRGSARGDVLAHQGLDLFAVGPSGPSGTNRRVAPRDLECAWRTPPRRQ